MDGDTHRDGARGLKTVGSQVEADGKPEGIGEKVEKVLVTKERDLEGMDKIPPQARVPPAQRPVQEECIGWTGTFRCGNLFLHRRRQTLRGTIRTSLPR